jgi:hypothetical protein
MLFKICDARVYERQVYIGHLMAVHVQGGEDVLTFKELVFYLGSE